MSYWPPARDPAWTRWPRRSPPSGAAAWPSRPISPMMARPRTWPRRRSTLSATSGRWRTTHSRGRRSPLGSPPVPDLVDVSLAAIRTSLDANVVAALQLTRLFIPALAATGGSVVMINSMVVRYSQRTMGPYKMAKAALLAMAESLATELGPQGIRVNSVAPGHIWGDSLKWYFGYLAKKRGVDAQQIYDETAAAIDLGKLPEPDEIADAVVFLASVMARAITGQCLDVNSGEYHH